MNLMFPSIERSCAINLRNDIWSKHGVAPSWVNLEEVGLDQFFTTSEIAERCYLDMIEFLESKGIDTQKYSFIEPSAGAGAFFDLMPKERRIGIDIMPIREEFIKHDFLTWNPKSSKKNLVIGNPPFGYRAWLALAFLNHAAKFSDHVGMILPMSFQSDGKGSPKYRVEGLSLQKSIILPQDSFVDFYGKPVKVNALWQIWSKGEGSVRKEIDCSKWVDVFTVDERKERKCGHDKMKEADFFLQRTFYKDPPSIVKLFSDVKYVCGYGIIIKREKERIENYLKNVDWSSYSNLAAHNCRHISMYHIKRALANGGFGNAR